VTVATGATLAGTGTVNGSLTINDGGIVAPGDGGIGTLNAAGGMALSNASVLTYQLNTTGASDKCIVTGNLTLDGTVNATSYSDSFSGAGTYTIMTYTGTLTNNTLNVGTMPVGFIGAISINAGASPKQVNLVLSAQTLVTISGTLYSAEGSSPVTGGKTVRIKVNGLGFYTATTHATNGTYSMSVPTIAAGNVITAYVDTLPA
jgi:fibronectin-binding autotransporter adhesin